MSDQDNGHKTKPSWLGNEQAKQRLSGGAVDNLFGEKTEVNAIAQLVQPGTDMSQLTMRADFPNVTYEVAAMHVLAKCREFHDKQGEQELLNVVAGLTSVGGRRINQLVQAICGDAELKKQRGTMNRVGDWFREKADMGKGNSGN